MTLGGIVFLFDELVITDDHTGVVRTELARLVVLLSSYQNIVVRVHIVRGQRAERWYDYTNITAACPQTLEDTANKLSFEVMRALATDSKLPVFSDDNLFGWSRVACMLADTAVHVQVEVFGVPSSKAALIAAESARAIASRLQ